MPSRELPGRGSIREELGINEEVKKLAQWLRTRYYQEYRAFQLTHNFYDPVNAGTKYEPKWDGGYDPTNPKKKHDNIWIKILKFGYKNQIEPQALVAGVFYYWRHPKHAPMPTHMLSDVAIESGRKYLKEFFKEKLLFFKVSLRKLTGDIRYNELVLKEENKPCDYSAVVPNVLFANKSTDPLAAYLVAVRFDQSKLALEFLHNAAVHYSTAPDKWKAALGKTFPEEVAAYAEEILIPTIYQGWTNKQAIVRGNKIVIAYKRKEKVNESETESVDSFDLDDQEEREMGHGKKASDNGAKPNVRDPKWEFYWD